MTEYFIYGISYSKAEGHIEWLRVTRYDKEEKVFYGDWLVSRSFVHDLISMGAGSFRTMFMNKETNQFTRGAAIEAYGEEFITTSADSTDKNNLEALPAFDMPESEIGKSMDTFLSENFPGIGSA